MQRLAEFLKSKPTISRRVTLLPDMFADQIITIPKRTGQFLSEASRILKRGGGNYLGISSQLVLGGCAANCAAALSRLDVPTSFVGKTSNLGSKLFRLSAETRYLDLSHLKTDGKLATTAALELQGDGERVNLMLTEPGSASNFAPGDLTKADYELLTDSFLVGIFSWNLNQDGTALLEAVARLSKEKNVRTYVDLGDPNPRLRQLPNLIDRVLRRDLVDYLSVNDNELRCLARCLPVQDWRDAETLRLSREISAQIGSEIEFHSASQACIVSDELMVSLPSFDVDPLRTTGAGDAWNAGNIYGLIRDAAPEMRLLMANLLAATTITDITARPISRRSLVRNLKGIRLKDS